jgi:DNA methyltransferase 1-associated protein 1
MGDVADILGLNEKSNSSADIAAKFFAEKPKAVGKGKKPKGMSREVFDLIGRDKDALVPSMQSNATLSAGAFKSKRASALKGKWVWARFTNSARPKEDGNSAFYHWVKADVQYTDYPYAKFNIKLDPVIFSDDEYEHLLRSDKWTRAETDHLMYICYKYDLRWPVIADRYMLLPSRPTEDIQERYYSIVTKVRSHRMGKGEGSAKHEPLTIFDLEAERCRRTQQECQFRKTKSDEAEETKLREELKMIDSVLKTKKEKVSKAAGADNRNNLRLAASESRQLAAATSVNAANFVCTSFALPVSSDNGPSAGKPGLQSTRLTSSDQSSGLSRVLLKKMNSLLREVGAPEAPLPTRAVCDAYDALKRETVTLLSLHNAIQKKEKEIATLRGLNCPDYVHKGIYVSFHFICIISERFAASSVTAVSHLNTLSSTTRYRNTSAPRVHAVL